jgi:hypothetical protein
MECPVTYQMNANRTRHDSQPMASTGPGPPPGPVVAGGRLGRSCGRIVLPFVIDQPTSGPGEATATVAVRMDLT